MLSLQEGQNVVVQADLEVIDFTKETALLHLRRDSFTIDMRTLSGGLLNLHPGDKVYVAFVRPDALYSFVTMVVSVDQDEKIAVLERRDQDIRRIQRRKYFRQYVRTRVRIRPLARGQAESRIAAERTAQAIDLSGGGALLRLEEAYRTGDLLAIAIFLPDGGPAINATAKVMQVREVSHKGGTVYHCGLRFEEIDETDRSRIVRHLFSIETQRRTGR